MDVFCRKAMPDGLGGMMVVQRLGALREYETDLVGSYESEVIYIRIKKDGFVDPQVRLTFKSRI